MPEKVFGFVEFLAQSVPWDAPHNISDKINSLNSPRASSRHMRAQKNPNCEDEDEKIDGRFSKISKIFRKFSKKTLQYFCVFSRFLDQSNFAKHKFSKNHRVY